MLFNGLYCSVVSVPVREKFISSESGRDCFELLSADGLDVFDYCPLDGLCAGRCCQRSIVVPVAAKVEVLK